MGKEGHEGIETDTEVMKRRMVKMSVDDGGCGL